MELGALSAPGALVTLNGRRRVRLVGPRFLRRRYRGAGCSLPVRPHLGKSGGIVGIDTEIAAQLDIWLNEIRVAQGEESAKAFVGRVRSWLMQRETASPTGRRTQPNRLTLYRDTWNQGAGGGGEGNGYSYRPDPDKETRVYVLRFLCGTEKSAPRTIVIEGLPPYYAAGARPGRRKS